MKPKNYTRNNPCYKSKIQYHQNQINNLINAAPVNINPVKLLSHLNSLNHFVKKQADIQQNQINHAKKLHDLIYGF
jgi:hypothetical protein